MKNCQVLVPLIAYIPMLNAGTCIGINYETFMTSISNTCSHRPDSICVIEFMSGKTFWSDLRGQG